MTDVGESQQISHDPGRQCFELQVDGHIAYLRYRRNGNRLVVVHTDVPQEAEGHGIGGRLVRTAVDHAAAEDLTLVPLCPFARGWLERHPDVADRMTIDWD
jgi:hypothetical protein